VAALGSRWCYTRGDFFRNWLDLDKGPWDRGAPWWSRVQLLALGPVGPSHHRRPALTEALRFCTLTAKRSMVW